MNVPRRPILALALVSILLAMVFAGFVFTAIDRSGFWLLFSFGLLGMIVFLQSFPWPALVVFMGLDVALAFFVQRFYGKRAGHLSLLIIGFIVLTLGGGFVLSRTPLYAGWRPPPPPNHGRPTDPFFRGYGAWRFHNLFSGTITAVSGTGYVITTPDDQVFVIAVGPGTEFPHGRDMGVGSGILVIGAARKDAIRAYGIRPFTPPVRPPRPPKP